MSLNSIAQKVYSYAVQNELGEGKTGNEAVQQNDKFTTAFDGITTLNIDADGDGTNDLTLDLTKLSDMQLLAAGLTAEEINEIRTANFVRNTEDESDDTDVDKMKQELTVLQNQRQANLDSMTKIEEKIDELTDEISKKTTDAIKEQVKLEDSQKEAAQKAVAQQVTEYTNRNKEGSTNPMSREELQQAIGASLQSEEVGLSSEMAAIASEFAVASQMMDQVDLHIGTLKNLGEVTKDIECQIQVKEKAIAQKEAENAVKESCDPIGAQVQDKDGNNIEINFFVDEDGDGKLSNANEFVGAEADAAGEDGWTEMQAFNTDGNDEISKEELLEAGENQGLMVAVTVNGEQKELTMAQFMEQYGDLSINANKDAQTNENVQGPNNFDGEGYDNQLLGTYGLTLNGKSYTGYQTKDDIDYLNDNFKFSKGSATGASNETGNDGETTVESSIGKVNEDGISEELQAHLDKIPGYEEEAKTLRASLESSWELFGIKKETIQSNLDDENLMNEFDSTISAQAKEEAEAFYAEIQKGLNLGVEIQNTETQETTEGQDETQVQDDEDQDPERRADGTNN